MRLDSTTKYSTICCTQTVQYSEYNKVRTLCSTQRSCGYCTGWVRISTTHVNSEQRYEDPGGQFNQVNGSRRKRSLMNTGQDDDNSVIALFNSYSKLFQSSASTEAWKYRLICICDITKLYFQSTIFADSDIVRRFNNNNVFSDLLIGQTVKALRSCRSSKCEYESQKCAETIHWRSLKKS